jgi:hypothetical protein
MVRGLQGHAKVCPPLLYSLIRLISGELVIMMGAPLR